MAISSENIQVASILPKEVVEKIDKMAKKEIRSRSQQIAHILIKYFETQKDS